MKVALFAAVAISNADALRLPDVGRRAIMRQTAALAGVAWLAPHNPASAASADYAGAKAAMAEMIKADPDLGPTMVRLAW